MERAELIRLARIGAQARLELLHAEIAIICRQFPDLARSNRSRTDKTLKQAASSNGRRRPKMTAAARKRIAEAQRMRWAAWRKKRAA